MASTLRLSRDQLAAIAMRNGAVDNDAVRQLELLLESVNRLVAFEPATDVVDVDTNVDATGVLLSVPVERGTYAITLNFTMTGVGAGAWQLSPENSAALAFTAFNYSAAGIETAGPFAFAVPSGAAAYLFSGDPLGVYAMTGTMVVTTAGIVGMRFVLTGGVSVTIHAGSRLVAQKVAS